MSRVVTPAGGWNLQGVPGNAYALELREAMEAGHVVSFIYDGKYRVVEVHAIGTSCKDASLVMRGVQIGGIASRPLPQWTLFTINKIDRLEAMPQASMAPREGYTQGDKQMQIVIAELAL